ncbi:MAG: YvcK family protein [Candidatus Sericytochromatia bacterium]|nr:YvcK family protein [Candidatus Sericytochromatia bacterium]
MSKKKVVCIGGGTGQASILSGLKKIEGLDLVSIVGVTDNGGYSGLIREAMGIPQPGDSRNCIGALCDSELLQAKLVNYRFTEGSLSGISLGNLIIAALTRITGDFSQAIKETAKLAGVVGKVLPVSTHSTHICAELVDNTIVQGEWEIIKREPRTRIKRLFLKDEAYATQEVINEIESAELIIICPGSLCTAIVSALLAKGLSEAIGKSKAKLIYICNIMTQEGQTDDFTVSDHINFIQEYIQRNIDYVIVNNNNPSTDLLVDYEKENSYPIVIDAHLDRSKTQIVLEDLLLNLDYESLKKEERPRGENMHVGNHLIRHDPEKLANILNKFFDK